MPWLSTSIGSWSPPSPPHTPSVLSASALGPKLLSVVLTLVNFSVLSPFSSFPTTSPRRYVNVASISVARAIKIFPQMPWLRLDALALNIVWTLPYYSTIAKKDVTWAWRAAGTFIPISYGWAAGDVSLAAYIQSALSAGDYGESYYVNAKVYSLIISCSQQVHRRLRSWCRDGLLVLFVHRHERDL